MAGSVGSTMTYAPNINGSSRPVSYRVSDGALPGGVVLDSTYGVISGTPTSANGGVGAVTIQASFADGTVRASTFNIAVDDPHHSANYPNRIIGTVGGPTAVIPETFDTTGPTSYTLVCGELPSGMVLDSKTGIIAGTPTAPVDFPIPLRVRQRDAYGSVDASLIMVVGAAPTPWIRYPDHPLATFGKPVSITPTLSELPQDAVFRLTGKLPRGLRFDQRTGVISGSSTSPVRSRALTVTAHGADGRPIASTATSISIRRAAVPLSVTAKPAATKVTRKATVLISKAQHPSWTKVTTRVSCTGCKWRADSRTGRVIVTPGPRTTRVTVTITATAMSANNTYRPHVWTRTWLIRK